MAFSRITYVLATLSMVLGASGHKDNEMAAHSGGSHAAQETPETTYPPTYFTLDTQEFAIQAHISLMIVSWFIILPIGKSPYFHLALQISATNTWRAATMLSLARSRYTHFVRLGFTAANIIGVIFGISYKKSTPDLYPGSAHSAVGWIATGIAAAQVSHLLIDPITKLYNRIFGRYERKAGGYTLTPMQESSSSLQDHDGPSALSRQASFDVEATQVCMESHDTSSGSQLYQEDQNESGFTSEDATFCGESDSVRALHHDPRAATSKTFSKPTLTRTRRIILLTYNLIDRTILLVAFVAFCTGIATFWGLFVSLDAPRTTFAWRNKFNISSAERKCHIQRYCSLD